MKISKANWKKIILHAFSNKTCPMHYQCYTFFFSNMFVYLFFLDLCCIYYDFFMYLFLSRALKDFGTPKRCARKPIVKMCRNTSDQGDHSSVKCP